MALRDQRKANGGEPSFSRKPAYSRPVVDNVALANRALVFIKPHANNERVAAMVQEKLKAAGITVTSEGVVAGSTTKGTRLPAAGTGRPRCASLRLSLTTGCVSGAL